MTTKQIQILVSGSAATIGEILGRIAEQPPQTMAQIPEIFPEQFRGWIGIVCQTASGVAFVYALFIAHQNPAPVITPIK